MRRTIVVSLRDVASLVLGGVLATILATLSGCGTAASPAAHDGVVAVASTAEPRLRERLVFHTDYYEAYRRAADENRPMLIFFETDDCAYSARMKSGTFHDASVAQLASQFVCVAVNAAAAPELCNDYEVKEFPTIQFVDAGGLRLARLIGQQTPRSLILQMHVVLQTVAGRRHIIAQPGLTSIRTL